MESKYKHNFETKNAISGDAEYVLIYCKKCGIVSYDQRYKSKSYENKYIPKNCLFEDCDKIIPISGDES